MKTLFLGGPMNDCVEGVDYNRNVYSSPRQVIAGVDLPLEKGQKVGRLVDVPFEYRRASFQSDEGIFFTAFVPSGASNGEALYLFTRSDAVKAIDPVKCRIRLKKLEAEVERIQSPIGVGPSGKRGSIMRKGLYAFAYGAGPKRMRKIGIKARQLKKIRVSFGIFKGAKIAKDLLGEISRLEKAIGGHYGTY